jgi:sodium transport system permease protein
MLRNVMILFRKEMLEVLKDRRTLVLMIILPSAALPLILSLVLSLTQKAADKSRSEQLAVGALNGQAWPGLVDAFRNHSGFQWVDLPADSSPLQAVRDGVVRVVLELPADTADRLAAGEQLRVKLHFNNASLTSSVGKRAREVVQQLNEQLRSERLAAAGFSTMSQRDAVVNPVLSEDVGTADMREVLGENLGGMLPYFYIIFCFLGALYPAIDLAAGEKERGTLETLLLTPVPRLHLVLGKFLVVFCSGIISALLCNASMVVWLLTRGKTAQGLMAQVISQIHLLDFLLILGMLIPVAAIFAALLLTISITARSFKEAQSLATPFNFMVLIPAMLAMIPGVELKGGWVLVPITNVSLAIKELVKGTMQYALLGQIMASTVVIAAALLLFCTYWFQREEVLFRE